MKNRVLMVTSVYPRHESDSTPPFVQNLAELMADAGYQIAVLAPHGAGASFKETAKGVTVYRFPYCWPLRLQRLCYDGGMLVNLRARPWTRCLLPFFAVCQFAALIGIIWRWKPDLLHSHSLLPQGALVALAAQLFRLPHITTSHGNDVFGLRPDGYAGRMKKWVLAQADAVTVNSSATESAVFALTHRTEKVIKIPAAPNISEANLEHAQQIRKKLCGTENGCVIGFVGRMITEKGVPDLLRAFSLIDQSVPHAQLCLVGDGQERDAFMAEAKRLGVVYRCHWMGWVKPNEVTTYMAAMDILVVPSRQMAGGWREAQGLVVVEALLTGTAVVASRTGGITDMIVHERTGLLFEMGDVNALAESIKRLLQDTALRKTLISHGRKIGMAQFSPMAVQRHTQAVYCRYITDAETHA